MLGGSAAARCSALRLANLRPGERRLYVAERKGGHSRIARSRPASGLSLAACLTEERRKTDREEVFVVLKGPRRGARLSVSGIDQVMPTARARTHLEDATCHQLRHTCLTRLREAGMALEVVQAQAGYRSVESTRIYLHLAKDWLTGEYTEPSKPWRPR